MPNAHESWPRPVKWCSQHPGSELRPELPSHHLHRNPAIRFTTEIFNEFQDSKSVVQWKWSPRPIRQAKAAQWFRGYMALSLLIQWDSMIFHGIPALGYEAPANFKRQLCAKQFSEFLSSPSTKSARICLCPAMAWSMDQTSSIWYTWPSNGGQWMIMILEW